MSRYGIGGTGKSLFLQVLGDGEGVLVCGVADRRVRRDLVVAAGSDGARMAQMAVLRVRVGRAFDGVLGKSIGVG